MDRKECQLHLALCEFIDILGSQIGLWEVGEKNDSQWYFVSKIVLTYCEENLLKFEAEVQEFTVNPNPVRLTGKSL